MIESKQSLLETAIAEVNAQKSAGEVQRRLEEEEQLLHEFETVVKPAILAEELSFENQIPLVFTNLHKDVARRIENAEGVKMDQEKYFWFREAHYENREDLDSYWVHKVGAEMGLLIGTKDQLVKIFKRDGKIPVVEMSVVYEIDFPNKDVEGLRFQILFSENDCASAFGKTNTYLALFNGNVPNNLVFPLTPDGLKTMTRTFAKALVEKEYYCYPNHP